MKTENWDRLTFVVAALLVGYIIIAVIGYLNARAECEALGGVPMKTYASGMVCMKTDAVIELRRKP